MARHGSSIRARFAVAASAILASACGTILGIHDLDGGPPGPDATAPLDASDGGASDALDAGRQCPPMPGDATAPTVAASCAASDGCAPSPFDASLLEWMPFPHESACSAAQIDAFDVACFGADSGTAQCAAFKAANFACTNCILNPQAGGDFGALIAYRGGLNAIIINVGACIAALDPCAIDCAMAVQLNAECEYRACAPSCGGASASAQAACLPQAASCPCQAYAQTSTACLAALHKSQSPAERCHLPGASLDDNLKTAETALCGNGT